MDSFVVKDVFCTLREPPDVIVLALVAWYGREPRYDIRHWGQLGTVPGRGISLTEAELRTLQQALNELFP